MLTRFVVGALVVVAAGCGSGEERRTKVPAPTATPPARIAPVVEEGALLGTVTAWSGNSGAILARVDRRSLEARAPWADLGEYHDAWSVSPDGRMAAFGISAPGETGGIGIRVIDLATLLVVRDHEVGIVAEAVGWLTPDRLVAFLQSGEVVVVDPVSGEEHARRALGAVSCPFGVPNAVTRAGFVMLASVAGAARLVVTEANGRVSTRPLPEIAAGESFGFCAGASLAVDQARLVAYVVGAHALVAEVDLRTMQVKNRRIAPTPWLLSAGGCRACGAYLGAVWLGRGRFAVAGYQLRPSGPRRRRVRPAGAVVIDTRDWTARTISRQAGAAIRAGDAVLAFDGRHPSGAPRRGEGLPVYDRSGDHRYTVLRGERVGDVQVAGARAYARTARGLRVVDLRRGRVIARFPRVQRDVALLEPR
jgi:hypothetical protein